MLMWICSGDVEAVGSVKRMQAPQAYRRHAPLETRVIERKSEDFQKWACLVADLTAKRHLMSMNVAQ